MQYRYRRVIPMFESPTERRIGDRALEAFSGVLGLRDRRLVFIAENPTGDIRSDRAIVGLSNSNGRDIFAGKGLPHRDLVLVIAHELRHEWQRTSDKKHWTPGMRERDAQLFALRFDPPRDADELLAWLVLLDRRSAKPENVYPRAQ